VSLALLRAALAAHPDAGYPAVRAGDLRAALDEVDALEAEREAALAQADRFRRIAHDAVTVNCRAWVAEHRPEWLAEWPAEGGA